MNSSIASPYSSEYAIAIQKLSRHSQAPLLLHDSKFIQSQLIDNVSNMCNVFHTVNIEKLPCLCVISLRMKIFIFIHCVPFYALQIMICLVSSLTEAIPLILTAQHAMLSYARIPGKTERNHLNYFWIIYAEK